MTWRSHGVTGRPHSFARSEKVSDCGLAASKDCGQTLLAAVLFREEVVRVVGAERAVAIPSLACGLCRRAVRARTRGTLKDA